jgi:hypothetical protein
VLTLVIKAKYSGDLSVYGVLRRDHPQICSIVLAILDLWSEALPMLRPTLFFAVSRSE